MGQALRTPVTKPRNYMPYDANAWRRLSQTYLNAILNEHGQLLDEAGNVIDPSDDRYRQYYNSINGAAHRLTRSRASSRAASLNSLNRLGNPQSTYADNDDGGDEDDAGRPILREYVPTGPVSVGKSTDQADRSHLRRSEHSTDHRYPNDDHLDANRTTKATTKQSQPNRNSSNQKSHSPPTSSSPSFVHSSFSTTSSSPSSPSAKRQLSRSSKKSGKQTTYICYDDPALEAAENRTTSNSNSSRESASPSGGRHSKSPNGDATAVSSPRSNADRADRLSDSPPSCRIKFNIDNRLNRPNINNNNNNTNINASPKPLLSSSSSSSSSSHRNKSPPTSHSGHSSSYYYDQFSDRPHRPHRQHHHGNANQLVVHLNQPNQNRLTRQNSKSTNASAAHYIPYNDYFWQRKMRSIASGKAVTGEGGVGGGANSYSDWSGYTSSTNSAKSRIGVTKSIFIVLALIHIASTIWNSIYMAMMSKRIETGLPIQGKLYRTSETARLVWQWSIIAAQLVSNALNMFAIYGALLNRYRLLWSYSVAMFAYAMFGSVSELTRGSYTSWLLPLLCAQFGVVLTHQIGISRRYRKHYYYLRNQSK